MTRYSSLLIAFAASLLLVACSDDDPSTMTHYFNPVWTPDGSTIVAGYVQAPTGPVNGPDGALGAPGSLAVLDMDTRVERIISLPAVSTVHTLYAFDPSGAALTFVENGGFYFYDLTGRELLFHQPTEGGIPAVMDFSNTGNSFLWLGSTPEGYTVNTTVYDAATWTIDNQITMFTIPNDSPVLALTHTSQRSFAVRLENGTVKEYDFNGSELNTFATAPFESNNPWHYRLMFYSRNDERYLFVRDDEGIRRLDLASGIPRLLVEGGAIDMDISAVRNSMVYETTTGDTWIATVEGNPLTRIAPMNVMPRISPANNGIAMVERTDVYTDSLHVLRLR